MSADSYHHQVDQAMKSKKCLYNFQDFEDCLLVCGIPVVMTDADVYDYKNNHGTGKDTNYPLLKDVNEVILKRGSTKKYWETDHSEEVFQSGEFLTKKFRAVVLGDGLIPKKNGPRYVTESMFEEIKSMIGSLIPKQKMGFWNQIPTNKEAKDLSINYDHLERQSGKKKDDLNMIDSTHRVTRQVSNIINTSA